MTTKVFIRVFRFDNTKEKELYRNTIIIDDALSFDSSVLLQAFQLLYPKSNISFTFLNN